MSRMNIGGKVRNLNYKLKNSVFLTITRPHFFDNIYQLNMEENILKFGKELFVSFKRQNINDNYQVIAKEVGKGSFGTVYKGKLRGTQGPWRAIKKIPKSQIKDINLLMNEIQVSVSLDNPNIVKIYEIYEFNQAVYIVSDLCEGGELFDRLDSMGSMNEKDARVIFKQMVQAINYLHLSKIVHRDLKPENFLFLKKDQLNLKLIDFGMAMRWEKSLNEELRKKGQKKNCWNCKSFIIQSYYVAPQVLNLNYDERCDIWSLGVILYVLLTACPPFDGETDRQILKAVKTMRYNLNIPELQGVSQEAKDLISRILVPANKRISLSEIFEHPWMKIDTPTTHLKVSFRKLHQFSKFSKLKKLTATFVVTQMSQIEVQKLGLLFRKLDLNHDGYITLDQLKLALADESRWLELKQLKHMIQSIDVDKNGKINYTQFLASSLERQQLFKIENLKKMFKLLDKDGNGEIEKKELQALFSEKQIHCINGKSVQQIFALCDKDKSGTIDFQQFKTALLN